MRMRFNHFHIIRTKCFRVYFRGSYSVFEIDFGKLGYTELVVHLFNKDKGYKRFISVHVNEWPRSYLSH